ncbi:hypothetical protein [Cryptosporangium minutisporangium]|uniref:Uncharacterized protein n=1 Tax=Cryptosporangium minutisporangium TaxID=113569 RepID=A0ABP6SWY5_9ACTN
MIAPPPATLVRRSRITAVVCAAVGVTTAFWAARRGWDPPATLIAHALPVVLAAAHQAAFRRLRWRSRTLPKAFLLRTHDGTPVLATPRPQAPHGAGLILCISLVGARIGNTWPNPAMDAAGLAVAVFLVVRWAGPAFLRPYLELDADGLRVGVFRPRLIPWDAIGPDSPADPAPGARDLPLPVTPSAPEDPEAPGRIEDPKGSQNPERTQHSERTQNPERTDDPASTDAWDWVWIDLRAVATDHTLVAAAIRYYRANPDARAGIGTEAGHAQLLTSR